MASTRNFDWFGAYVVGLVTAIGGGTTRDLLLGVTPFWMEGPRYLIITGVALLTVILFKKELFRLGRTLFVFDTLGLALFTVSGIGKSLELGLPMWLCIIMGTLSGSMGGVIRDLIIRELPLLFREDVYALACVAGGFVYYICMQFQGLTGYRELAAASMVIILRLLAVRFKWELPKLPSLDG